MYLPVGKGLSLATVATIAQRTRLLYFTGDPTRAAPTDSEERVTGRRGVVNLNAQVPLHGY